MVESSGHTSPVQTCTSNPNNISYPFPCVKCRKKESVQEDGVDAGKTFSCGVMVENIEAGIKSFYCPWFDAEPVMTHIEDKVKCESESSTCLCQPNNNGGKGACGKIISPVYDAEFEQRKALKARYEVEKSQRIRPVIIAPDLNDEDKPGCFGCYGYRICVDRTTPPSNCVWEERCYNSQRDY